MEHQNTIVNREGLVARIVRGVSELNILLVALLCLGGTRAIAQGVAINTTGDPADASAMLDVSSYTKGMLVPRMTKAQRNAIPLPAAGLVVYQTDSTRGLYFNFGTPDSPAWFVFGGDSYINSDIYASTAVGVNALGFNQAGSWTGWGNTAFGNSALYSNTTGNYNTATGNHALYSNTTGQGNTASGEEALGENTAGVFNTAIGFNVMMLNTTGSYNTAVGKATLGNNITGEQNTAIGNDALPDNITGLGNTACGAYALASNDEGNSNTASGREALYNNYNGNGNTAIGDSALWNNGFGNYLTGIGYGANVGSDALENATVIGSNASVNSSNTMVFGNGNVIRWGFGVNAAAGHALQVGTNSGNGNGAYLTSGGTWTNASDRNKKENFIPVDGQEILKKIDQLPITRWNYKGEAKEVRHIGPMAQDFNRIFDVGNDDKSISTIDPAGIALAAIKELYHEVSALKAENARLKKINDELLGAQSAAYAEIALIERTLIDLKYTAAPVTKVSQNAPR